MKLTKSQERKWLEVQRAQKALFFATKESKESNGIYAIMNGVRQYYSTHNAKRSRGMFQQMPILWLPTWAKWFPAYSKISQDVAGQSILGDVQKHEQVGVTRADAREKHRKVHDTCQDAEEIEVSTEEYDMVRPKVFHFQSIQSVIIVNLKPKSNHRSKIC